MKCLAKVTVLTLLTGLTLSANAQETGRRLPTKFIGNRIFVQPVTRQGDTLNIYTDTGGSLVLTKQTADRLQLTTEKVTRGNLTLPVASLPGFLPSAAIPAPPLNALQADAPFLHRKYKVMQGRLPVRTAPKKIRESFGDGLLGQPWFATRIWTFDYPNKKLILHNSYHPGPSSSSHRVPVFFKENGDGLHQLHFPRIQAVISGDTLNLLFDTGATVTLTEQAKTVLNDDLPAVRATSFIIESQFEEWRSAHPEWKVIENGDQFMGADLIRVPKVTIAGYTVGPVWFTARPDSNFHEFMSKWMDKQVDGAVGGSLFQYFKITVNYPEEYAIFERL